VLCGADGVSLCLLRRTLSVLLLFLYECHALLNNITSFWFSASWPSNSSFPFLNVTQFSKSLQTFLGDGPKPHSDMVSPISPWSFIYVAHGST